MKLNKTKFLIPSLAIVAGACLVGSVSGTVAWYQYSTRVTAAMLGTSVKCSDTLEIQAENIADSEKKTDFKTALRVADMNSNIHHGNFEPVTPVNALAAHTALAAEHTFKKNPVYKTWSVANWRDASNASDYVQFKLNFRSMSVEGTPAAISKQHLYLTNLTIRSNSGEDLSDAVRVHISGTDATLGARYLLLSKSETAETTSLYDYLDLNGDGQNDATGRYEWDTGDANVATKYGLTDGTQVTAPNAANAESLATIADNGNVSGGYDFGAIAANAAGGKTLTVTVWLEGWAKLAPGGITSKDNKAAIEAVADPADKDVYKAADTGKYWQYNAAGTEWVDVTDTIKSAVWDKDYVGAQFNVGFEFAVNPSDGVSEGA